MSPDDLIAAFKELAQADPSMRIDRTVVGDVEEVRVAGWVSVRTKHKFEALASDAAELLDPDGEGRADIRWLRMVIEAVPELVEDGSPRGSLGYAIENGKRVQFVSETIPNAASASVLATRRIRDGITPRQPPPPVSEVAIEAALKQCPTMLDALVYLTRRGDRRATTEAEREGKRAHHEEILGEPIDFALKWVYDRCTWPSGISDRSQRTQSSDVPTRPARPTSVSTHSRKRYGGS